MTHFEIRNKQYSRFLKYLKKNDKLRYDECKPDSSLWLNSGFVDSNYRDSLYQYYHSHIKYEDYPVVNIKKEAAQEYIDWLSEIDPNPNWKYFLPTEAQWLAAFSESDSSIFSWSGNYWRNSVGGKLANFAEYDQNYLRYEHTTDHVEFIKNEDDAYSFFVKGPLKSWSHNPNDFGIYNMCGNVAEMIFDKNYTKGGSWHSPIHYLKRNSIEFYEFTITLRWF